MLGLRVQEGLGGEVVGVNGWILVRVNHCRGRIVVIFGLSTCRYMNI